jgi:hypothetical protein
MRIEEYLRNLQILVQQKYLGPYLAPLGKEALLEPVGQLRDFVQNAKRRKGIRWNFSIPRERPLSFKENETRLQVDLAGKVEGEGDDIREVRTLLRVWSLDKAMCYRVGVDSKQIEERFEQTGKRVIVRYHFDCRAPNVKEPEPIYHLQVGGNSLDEENCWFPKHLEIPRFHFPPMDIVLLCELVLANFFHQESENLRKTPEWVSLVRKSQYAFQVKYFEQFHLCFNNDANTLLGHLISMRGL